MQIFFQKLRVIIIIEEITQVPIPSDSAFVVTLHVFRLQDHGLESMY